MAHYHAGRRFEYRVKKMFKKRGFYVVRSAASKGVFDLVAIPPITSYRELPLGIQCFRKRKTKEEIRNLLNEAKKYKIIPCVAVIEQKRKLRILEGTNEITRYFKL